MKRPREIIAPLSVSPRELRPIRAEAPLRCRIDRARSALANEMIAAPSPVSSRLLLGKNAAFDKST
jgi:hypothetical protein